MEDNKSKVDAGGTEAPAKPKVEVLIVRHKQLFEMLKHPELMWRVLLSLFFVIVVLFAGLALVVISIKSFYPYNSIRTNSYGATIMESEDTEVSYWLFNTAVLWANSGIRVKKDEVLTIRASGAAHTAIHHLVDEARENRELRDAWVGTGGMYRESSDKRDQNRRRHRIAPDNLEGMLLMKVDPLDIGSGDVAAGGKAGNDLYLIGEEREDLVVRQDGVLKFAVNDIELDKATIKSMYRKNLRLMADSGVIDEDQFNRISDAFTKWYSGEDRGALLRLNAAIFNDEKKIKAAGEFYALGHYPQSECKEYYDAYPLVNELLYYYDKGFTDAWYVDNVGSFLIVIERKKE